jgi:hypothetical protein
MFKLKILIWVNCAESWNYQIYLMTPLSRPPAITLTDCPSGAEEKVRQVITWSWDIYLATCSALILWRCRQLPRTEKHLKFHNKFILLNVGSFLGLQNIFNFTINFFFSGLICNHYHKIFYFTLNFTNPWQIYSSFHFSLRNIYKYSI